MFVVVVIVLTSGLLRAFTVLACVISINYVALSNFMSLFALFVLRLVELVFHGAHSGKNNYKVSTKLRTAYFEV